MTSSASLEGRRPRRLSSILRGPLRGHLRMRQAAVRSRDAASHPSFASRFKKALPRASLEKKGGGAPISASTGFRPAAERKACQRMRRAPSLSPANGAGSNGGALAFRRPTAVMRRGALPSTRFRAALPGITGSKREDPLRHQCSQHLAVRSRAGRSMPRTARICSVSLHLREPPPLRLGVPSRRRPSSSGILYLLECNLQPRRTSRARL